MKGLKSLAISLCLNLLIVSFSYAICFDNETASHILMDLEKCQITNQQIETLKKENEELQKQINLLKQMVELQKEQVKLSQQTIDTIQKTCEAKTNEMERACKPSFWKELKDRLLFTVGGVLLGIVLMH